MIVDIDNRNQNVIINQQAQTVIILSLLYTTYLYNTERNTTTIAKILEEIVIILVKNEVEQNGNQSVFEKENGQCRKTL